MAIRLTESRLRQIIRHELLEAGMYLSPDFRRQFTYEGDESNVHARALQTIWDSRIFGDKLSFSIENAWWKLAGNTWELRDLWNQIVMPVWKKRSESGVWFSDRLGNEEAEISAWKEWIKQASQLIGKDVVEATLEALAPSVRKKVEAKIRVSQREQQDAARNLAAGDEYDREQAARAAAPPAPPKPPRPAATGPRWKPVVDRIIKRYDPENESWMETIPDRDMSSLSNQLGGIRAPHQTAIENALVAGGIPRHEAGSLVDSAYHMQY